jgi:hypothetical protein
MIVYIIRWVFTQQYFGRSDCIRSQYLLNCLPRSPPPYGLGHSYKLVYCLYL